jgi:hypothetical protein
MSKARLVITAVITEGRSQGEAARAYGVSQGWVSRLVARYRAEGEAAFEPRSRRPTAWRLPADRDAVRVLAGGGPRTQGHPAELARNDSPGSAGRDDDHRHVHTSLGSALAIVPRDIFW